MPNLPTWVPGRVLYQVHSLGAAGAPTANTDVFATAPPGHGLRALDRWLDHIAGLGFGGLLLTPISVSSTHGYDSVDPFRIDQRLGDDADFDALLESCHRRDVKVILDGVFNHVGRDFAPFRDVLAQRGESPATGWFRLDFATGDGDGFGYDTFEGHRELVALNHANAAVLEWATDAALRWLARGADGWRFDAAYAIPRPFLRALTQRIREQYPDAFLFGEVIHGDYARFVGDTGLHSVTQYELHKAIWSSFNDHNLFELDWCLRRHAETAASFAPVTFVGNHDVTRLATQLDDHGHFAAAIAILFTVPGVPCVYYGDEFAWTGRKEHRAGGDDAIRPALPESTAPEDERQRLVLDWHSQLIGLRRANAWLTGATLSVESVANRRLTYAVRTEGDSLNVTVDLDGAAQAPPGSDPIFTAPGVVIARA